MTAEDVRQALNEHASAERARINARYFKTGPGQYGEGDQFIGATVPDQRQVAKRFKGLPFRELDALFHSPVHEHRLTACLLLVYKFQACRSEDERTRIYDYFMGQIERGRVNNWDLVDTSTPQIVGAYLQNKSRSRLYDYARSGDLWKKRVSILATQAFIREGDFADTIAIAELLLGETHDLIHKAVGWMLREVGNRDRPAEEVFLSKHYRTMPRTMLRYAVERFPIARRQAYLAGTI